MRNRPLRSREMYGKLSASIAEECYVFALFRVRMIVPRTSSPTFLAAFGSRQPLELALALLQPAGFLSLHFQGEDLNLAGDNLPAFQTLFIREGTRAAGA